MAQNPLLGNRISLISKKNIRYEGTLYSINESNATVALQNVRSYGTEGRETTEPDTSYVPPQDEVHPYLLFRGCDIKDLHVHETAVAAAAAEAAAAAAASSAAEKAAASTATEAPAPPPPAPPAGDLPPPPPQPQSSSAPAPAAAPTPAPAANRSSRPPQQQQQNQNHQQQQQSQGGGGGGGRGGPNRRPRKPNPANQVGTGASLLNRKARGTVEGVGPEAPDEEFDFQSKLEEFEKEGDENEDDNDNDDYDDEAGDGAPESGHHPTAYEKDDFFDSISCDAIDRERGLDNRLRGANERHLNTETFGAVALNSQRRRRGGGRGSGGRGGGSGGGGSGRGGGRGSGRGRGRGRGRSGRGRGGAAGGSGGRYSNSTGMPAVASS